MKNKKLETLGFCLSLAFGSLFVGACGDSNEDDDGSGSAGETAETTADTTGDGDGDGDCGGTHTKNAGGAAAGEACTDDADCESNLCLMYTDVPPDTMAVCAPQPDSCKTRIAGTVFEFPTMTPVADANVKVAGAIGAASNPTNAPAQAEGSTDAMGRFDMVSNDQIDQPLGIVGIVTKEGYHLSATGVQSPQVGNNYGPGTGIHDVWAVNQTTLDGWNTALAGDANLAEFLPLGDEGGVIGFARDAATGGPKAGVTVVQGDSSNAQVRYLNATGDAFDAAATTDSGVFILVNPGLGENFGAALNGTDVDGVSGTAGSTSGSLFILIMDIP